MKLEPILSFLKIDEITLRSLSCWDEIGGIDSLKTMRLLILVEGQMSRQLSREEIQLLSSPKTLLELFDECR